MIKTAIFIILVLLNLEIFNSEINSFPKDLQTVVNKKEIKKFKEETKHYVITVFLPISNNKNIEKEITEWINLTITEFKKDIVQNQEEFCKSSGNTNKFVLYIDCAIYKTKSFWSYIITNYQWVGGVHGIYEIKNFIYTKSGKRINLTDLFIDINEVLEIIAKCTKNQLGFNNNADIEYLKRIIPSKKNYELFYLTETDIVFIFPP